jgi:23S rRNA (uracil1939-C5)-methyltransferase
VTRTHSKATADPCPHRPPCTACPRYGEPGIAGPAQDALDQLAHAHGLAEVPVFCGRTSGFRLRARLAIRGRLGSPKVGLFRIGTHRVVHVPNCRVHHPLINHVAAVVRRALVEARVTSYSDAAHLGVARYLQVVVERSSQSAQVVLVANSPILGPIPGPTPEPLAACLDLIRDRLGADLHSLWLNTQSERSNVVLGREFHHWCGPSNVIERFGGPEIHYPPGAFGQSNLEVAELIIGHLRTQVPQGARVAEFYAGTGAIGLSLLGCVGALSMNEASTSALAGLELGLAGLDAVERAKITVVEGPAGEAFLSAAGADVVIADPPRKGLDFALMDHLRSAPPARLLYVSCGIDSLVDDAATLTARGTLRLAGLSAFNLFPFSEHVETVARFERADRSAARDQNDKQHLQ